MHKVTKVSGSREIMYITAFFAKQQLSRLSRYGHLNSCGKTSFVLNKQNHDKLSTAKVWTLRSGGSVGNLFSPCILVTHTSSLNWISGLHLVKMLNVINFVRHFSRDITVPRPALGEYYFLLVAFKDFHELLVTAIMDMPPDEHEAAFTIRRMGHFAH